MSNPLEDLWGESASTILDAIYSSGGYTQRSVRGVLGEHLFKPILVATMPEWIVAKGDGKGAVDYSLSRGDEELFIQCKVMRSQKGKPLYKDGCPVVECQKTNGKVKGTRTYKQDQFDILAVSLWPISQKWDDWAYCCAYHLERQPRPSRRKPSIRYHFLGAWVNPHLDWERCLAQVWLCERIAQVGFILIGIHAHVVS